MLRNLGCDYSNLNNLKTAFPHPTTKEPVATFLHACHMRKLVRNTLCDKKALANAEDGGVVWHFIERLHEDQTKEARPTLSKQVAC